MKIIVLFVCFVILLGIIFMVFEIGQPSGGTRTPSILQIIGAHFSGGIDRSSSLVFENCTTVNLNMKVELNKGDSFTYKRTMFPERIKLGAAGLSPTITGLFGIVVIDPSWPSTLSVPLILHDTYYIKEVKHYNTSTCYVVASNIQYVSSIRPRQKMLDFKPPIYVVHVLNYTFDPNPPSCVDMYNTTSCVDIYIDSYTIDRTICENSISCEDMFNNMPFALYMLSLDQKFEGIVEHVIDYKYNERWHGIKVKNIEKNITLKTTYTVIGEENINNTSCYKVKIVKEYICDKENIVCNDLYLIVWVDKERRIVVQYETYHGNKLIERSYIVK